MTTQSSAPLATSAKHSQNGQSEPSVVDWVTDAARDNPVLAVGAAVAVGALAAMAIAKLKAPPSRARALEKQLGRQLASMESTLRRNRPLSSMADRLADTSAALTSRIGTWDTAVLEDMLKRAGELSSRFARGRG